MDKLNHAFRVFAKWAAWATGHPLAFVLAASTIIGWAVVGPIFGFSDTWQLVINTGTTIITFLMVFLIQNTQNRDTAAIHIKLDELIRAVEGAHNALLDLEEMEDADLELMRKDYEKLASTAREQLRSGEVDTEVCEVVHEGKQDIDAEKKEEAIVTSAAQALDAIPRLRLAKLPTPIDELANLTRELGGPTLIVKRDDLTGLAGGGNKVRKLEFLIADALRQGADCLITVGGPQSNHCRQTAAAAALVRLPCHLVLGGETQPLIGNSLIDHLLGATIHWTPRTQRSATMAALADELRSQGRRPYVIPVGGSTAVGALGYVAAMFELVEQLTQQGRAVHHLVFATSSGGTQAGIVLGARLAGFKGRITAVSIDQTPDDQPAGEPAKRCDEKFLAGVCAEANAAASLLGSDVRLSVADFATAYDYLGGGYGVVGELERDAIKLLARAEGLLVGPVYTGRAAGAMIDMIRRGVFAPDETVLFWHTGDDVALDAYAKDLS